MTQGDDWRRSATAEQMRSVVRTIDPSVAHIARIQDYWLGGKDHFEADRVARHARDGVHAIGELPGLLPRADVVVILIPVTDETRQLVNKDFLRAMKDGALLVNAARGVIVDTDALLEELTSGRITAALDVTDPEPLPEGHPLWQAPGLLLTPHVGGAIYEARERAYRVVSEQLARLAAGEPLLNVIGDRGY